MNRLSIIVTTCGRPELLNALFSIRDQWDGEEVVVVAEGDTKAAERIFDRVDPRITMDGNPAWTFTALGSQLAGEWGHNLANYALNHRVSGSHVCRLDDDDAYVDGALDAMADAVRADTDVSVYKAKWGPGHPASGVVLWHQPNVAYGNVATPMAVWRRGVSRFGLDYGGDFRLYEALREEFPVDGWTWDERIIVEVRPVAVEDA